MASPEHNSLELTPPGILQASDMRSGEHEGYEDFIKSHVGRKEAGGASGSVAICDLAIGGVQGKADAGFARNWPYGRAADRALGADTFPLAANVSAPG